MLDGERVRVEIGDADHRGTRLEAGLDAAHGHRDRGMGRPVSRVGVNCTTSSLQPGEACPAASGDEKSIDCSAAARSATGRAKVTVTGMPTPTTSPGAGAMFATERADGTAATPVPTDPVSRQRRQFPLPPARTAALYASFHPPMSGLCYMLVRSAPLRVSRGPGQRQQADNRARGSRVPSNADVRRHRGDSHAAGSRKKYGARRPAWLSTTRARPA